MDTDLSRLSAGALADTLGSVKATIAPLAAMENALKAEIKRRGLAVAEGTLFRVTCAPSARTLVDAKRLKAERPDVYRAYSYVSTSDQVTCSARQGVAVDAVERGEERDAA